MLTAEEVAALNLSGVEWAVLSGCDTGVGEVRAGEGVFGLASRVSSGWREECDHESVAGRGPDDEPVDVRSSMKAG